MATTKQTTGMIMPIATPAPLPELLPLLPLLPLPYPSRQYPSPTHVVSLGQQYPLPQLRYPEGQ